MDINTSNMDSFGWKTDEPAGFQSLKTALKAYFESYHSTLLAHPILPLTALKKRNRFEIEEYKALHFTTITHFQHFFEFRPALSIADFPICFFTKRPSVCRKRMILYIINRRQATKNPLPVFTNDISHCMIKKGGKYQ